MPTKPTDLPVSWATNTNYSIGPKSGQPTKLDPTPIIANGCVPGKAFPTAAEHMNFQVNRLANWVKTWVSLGTNDDDKTAHIVETDTTGRIRKKRITVTGDGDESGEPFQAFARDNGSGAAAFVTHGSTATVRIGMPANAIEVVSSGVNGLAINSINDCYPLRLVPTSSEPATFADGGVHFRRRTIDPGDDSVSAYLDFAGVRHSLALYNRQFLRETRIGGASVTSSSFVTMVGPFKWTQRRAPQQNGVALIWSLYFEATGTPGEQLHVRVRNNGVDMAGSLEVFVMDGTDKRCYMRRTYNGSMADAADQFEVTAARITGSNTITITNASFTIESTD